MRPLRECGATCPSRKALHARNLIVTFNGRVAVFEPENSLEALMQAAGKDPAVAPAFYQALLETEIYNIRLCKRARDLPWRRRAQSVRNVAQLQFLAQSTIGMPEAAARG